MPPARWSVRGWWICARACANLDSNIAPRWQAKCAPPSPAASVAQFGELVGRFDFEGVPASAEPVAIATIATLMRETGARVHLARLSSAGGVDLVRQAKAEGLPLSCDVGIHHLLLTDRDIGYFDSQYRFTPPLRSPADRDALSKAVQDRTVDAICSDHTPVHDDAQNVPFAEAEPGASTPGTFLFLTLKWAEDPD